VTTPTYAYDQNNSTYASINIGAATYPYPSWFDVAGLNVSDPQPKPSLFLLDVKMRYSVTITSAKYRILLYVGDAYRELEPWTATPRPTPIVRTWSFVPEPNDGVWNWTDVSNLRIRVEVNKTTTSGTGTFREYETWVTAPPSDRFVVGVSVTNIKNLYSYEFCLNWTGAVLNVTRIAEGPFLNNEALSQGGSTLFIAKTYNGATGNYTVVSNSMLNPATMGAYGTGVLAYIEFQVELPYNVTNLHLYNNMTSDPLDPLIPHTTTDGYFKNWMRGDANGDRLVNSLDLGTLNGHWAPSGGAPPWSLGYSKDVDCNMDGYINSLDLGVVNGNWGDEY
jgi:hypothetical protein